MSVSSTISETYSYRVCPTCWAVDRVTSSTPRPALGTRGRSARGHHRPAPSKARYVPEHPARSRLIVRVHLSNSQRSPGRSSLRPAVSWQRRGLVVIRHARDRTLGPERLRHPQAVPPRSRPRLRKQQSDSPQLVDWCLTKTVHTAGRVQSRGRPGLWSYGGSLP